MGLPISNAPSKAWPNSNGGLLFPPDVTIGPLRDQITALAARHGVPAIYSGRSFVVAGGLVSYSAEFADLWPRL
jgi:putative tryptophan/tyrosine transport system substrate-binding protein